MKRLFIFIMGVMMAVVATSRTFDMKQLGADAKGIKPCTKLINQTIEKAASEGGGTIYFPAGTYLTATIHMKSNITLHLESGAIVRFSDRFEDYLPFVTARWEGTVMQTLSPLIYAHSADNLTITGRGTLDGNGLKWWLWEFETRKVIKENGGKLPSLDKLQQMWVDANKDLEISDYYKPSLERKMFRPPFIQFYECTNILIENVKIDPTNTAARMTLLGEAIRKEDYKEVIRLCEAGIESNPDMLEFYFYLSIAYNQADRTDDALAICKKGLENIPEKSDKEFVSNFYAIMGDIYHTKKMNTEAYAAYDSALVYNSANLGALNNYAYYLSLERRDLDKAEEMSYKTVKSEPKNSTYLDTYAWILFEKGNYAEARLYIDDAIKNDKDQSDTILEHGGDIYYMTGDVDGALKYWKQAQEVGSESKTLKKKIDRKRKGFANSKLLSAVTISVLFIDIGNVTAAQQPLVIL